MMQWGNGAGGETRTPNRPITNRVLYQLSHASTSRLFTRDFCLVNSSDAQIPAFNATYDANPDYCAQVALPMQSNLFIAGRTLLRVSWSLLEF